MPQLTWYMERPKGFKKEFTMDETPNFEEMSRRNPLPETEHQENNSPSNERQENTESMNINGREAVFEQVSQNFNENSLRFLMNQPVNPLLIQMQDAVHLRELWLRQQLASAIAGHRPESYHHRNNRTQSLVEWILLANLINRMQ